jgi:hypothetical protein
MIMLSAALALAFASVEASAGEFVSDPSVLACTPARVTQADTVVITKRSSTLRELAVRGPHSARVHFLVVSSPPPEMPHLLTSEEFSQRTVFELSVSGLVGLEWIKGAAPERVFTRPGIYTFLSSSTLESDVGGVECQVEYVEAIGDAR